MIPVEIIKKKAEDVSIKNRKVIRFVTVGRVDYQKAYPRLIKILSELKQSGYCFRWIIVGNGEEFDRIKSMIKEKQLNDDVEMLGELENPFIEIKKADIFALLSDFEGLPNTIYEALILGIPVLATDVGGVNTQIEDGINGWLVENKEKEIRNKLEWLLMHQEEIIKVKKNNERYYYDNEKIQKINEAIFSD